MHLPASYVQVQPGELFEYPTTLILTPYFQRTVRTLPLAQ